MDQHCADQAAFVATLSPDDDVRRRAYAHAAGCAVCREALEEGRALLALLKKTIGKNTIGGASARST